MPVHLPPISRRRFLGATFATGVGLVLPDRLWARTGADPDRWILLSDLHIPDQREGENRGVKPVINFEQARGEYLGAAADAAGVIVSGDLARNEGLPGDYSLLANLVRPIREAGLALHLALGNHDHRENFSQVDGLHLINVPTLVWVFVKTQPQGWVDVRLRGGGASLKLHALDRGHAAHGEVKELTWRG